MGVTLRFIASPDEGAKVLDWFRELPTPPEFVPKPNAAWLYFRDFGGLANSASGGVDVQRSPLVSVFLPKVRREILWTVGEVHFLAARMPATFPELQRVLVSFRKWLQGFPPVFHQPHLPQTSGGRWDYYLEGSVRNRGSDIFALPEGMAALERGQYFVCDDDSEPRLDTILRMLKLRGVEPNAAPNSRPPSSSSSSLDIQTLDSQRASSSGGCG